MASEPPGPYAIGSDTWPGLATLAADAAQVVRAISAIIGNGDDTGPDADRQRECLQDQLGDLRAAIDYVVSKNALDWNAVNKRRDRKRSRYERDHHHAAPPAHSAGNTRPEDAAGSTGAGPRDGGAGNSADPSPRAGDAAGGAGPGAPQQGAAGTGQSAPCDQDYGHSWPVPRQHALSRSAPTRSARRPARARAATPSSVSPSD